MMRLFSLTFLLLGALLVSSCAGVRVRGGGGETAGGGEYVIASGGPALALRENDHARHGDRHDRYWGNFVTAARIRMDQLMAERGHGIALTWRVSRPAVNGAWVTP